MTSNAIAGNVTVGALMDASGFLTETERVKRGLREIGGAADRQAAALKTFANASQMGRKMGAFGRMHEPDVVTAGMSEYTRKAAADAAAVQANIHNMEAARVTEMAALQADIRARSVAGERQRAVEERAIRDNEYNDIMAKLRSEQEFRDDVRSRLAPSRNIAQMMATAIPSVSPMAAGMAKAAATQEATFAAERQAAAIRAEELRDRVAVNMGRRRATEVIEQIRAQQDAAIRAEEVRDRVAVNMARRRSADVISQIREQQAAREAAELAAERRVTGIRTQRARGIIEQIRATEEARRNNVGGAIGFAGAMPAELNQAEAAIARMRADLQPMVGMEMRLAEEAREFRDYVQRAVVAGRMNVDVAQQLTAEFQQQQNLLRQRAAAEHQGFLGMRRMGFAAQQLGYAVEDAASQFGTMGLAGAFRAGSNNLTAMAAVMSPMVGVAASLTAAAVALGIQWWQAKKHVDATNKALERTKEITKGIEERLLRQNELTQQSIDAMTASGEELLSMYESNANALAKITAELTAQSAAADAMVNVRKLQAQLAFEEQQAAEASAKWWKEQFNFTIHAYELLKDLGKVIAVDPFRNNFFGGREVDRAAEERADKEHLLKIEQDRVAALADQNQKEAEKLALLQAQEERLQQIVESHKKSMHTILDGRNLEQDVKNRLRDSGDVQETLRSKFGLSYQTAGFGGIGGQERRASTVIAGVNADRNLVQVQGELIALRERMLEVAQNEQTSAEERLRIEGAVLDINKELSLVDAVRVANNERGAKALESVNSSLVSRFESLNKELGFENEILETRKKINEEIDHAVASGHISEKEAMAYRAELDRVVKLEEERNAGEKRLADLEQQSDRLKGLASLTQSPTVLAGIKRGSNEAASIIEKQRLAGMNDRDKKPIVDQLIKVREEIKKQKEALEKIAEARPMVAQF